MLNNLPQVTKNLLILNIMFFAASWFLGAQDINLISKFGAHYVNSPLFEPFQVVTHFFMHANFIHIFFNMWIFIMLGGYLEKIWGPKRFFIFYILCALGAFALFNVIGVYEIEALKTQIIDQGHSIREINRLESFTNNELINQYLVMINTPMVGASGAIFGVMAAFAILFPNTEFRLYFAIPIKAKWFVGAYFLFEVYQSYLNESGDSTAHLAHVGGAVVGAIIVLFWRKKDRNNFW
ncbi:MAG: rhomboid family intramembrane serine protease [Crocinitomicaceae bacterium]|nr:rhomboid family intramembrane serine protease [Crocinitomicaceae bacterium]MDG1736321.1 rhomboid family intramembrane serine protease [Crocinitomicaceae bacterium]MDG2506378.1 rhomboid family intramembrane serine protease [Crocinitomicaceae bacterium]